MTGNRLYDLFLTAGGKAVTDSRRVMDGDIFFALRGENFNGNDFAIKAIEKGASLAVVDDPGITGEGIYYVEDVLAALQSLAIIHRRNMDVPVLAITGSNGKTTTKELVATVLATKYRVHFTPGNLNNHIGVPLTILSAPPETELMIIEMGANHGGEIRRLCEIADPGYGLITNIGRAHLEGFGSPEGVVAAKSELYQHLGDNGGRIIYNNRDPLLSAIVDSSGIKAYSYEAPGNSAVRMEGYRLVPGLTVDIGIDGTAYTIETGLFGIHNVDNIMAAVACGLVFNVGAGDIARSLNGYSPDNNRSQLMVTETNTVICDSYNANPTSVANAIRSFMDYPGEPKTIILGDMLELGSYAIEEHTGIVNLLKTTKCRR
ncbi:MAG: UDP-N-acetylmuramoyl-tripeptide--D-alanyl-D-alanine ligase [Bacteroidales bacterium]